jgi:hypothetical protein
VYDKLCKNRNHPRSRTYRIRGNRCNQYTLYSPKQEVEAEAEVEEEVEAEAEVVVEVVVVEYKD